MGYWGGLERISQFTPYCSSRHFLHENTVKRGWDDAGLHRSACALAVGKGADTAIRDTIVVTHSMGNLIFAEALRQGTCSLENTSKWISIQAPWQGSKAAPWVSNICSNHTSSRLLRWLAGELQYCDPDLPGQVYRGYESLRPDFPGLQNLIPVAQANVHRALCGSSAYGLQSSYSAALEALALEVKYGEYSDGMVSVSSCTLPGASYEGHYTAPFYMAQINHVDGTCRVGDGIIKKADRLPCEWLSSVVQNATETVFV
eukprot:CAMPEP_0115437164 /NCGR_PEP_ID=MMETSP0271-20121206/34591_1 /TAXON_ID=71861 /ORGANISM="Scrippsiella trochoidea, Strain CCMP3099" /LENGTH=258 /DNA_ID=CAMNT_0002862759 /DNA_START=10 /DNA_END=786 /DNA_ORIENTATION=+